MTETAQAAPPVTIASAHSALPKPVLVATTQPRKIRESRFQRAEHVRTIWTASVDAGTPFDDILKTEFWGHIVGPKNLQVGDQIEVYPDEGHYFALLYVRKIGPQTAGVEILFKVEFDGGSEVSEDNDGRFTIDYRGRVQKHAVIRNSDKQVLKAEFGSKVEAEAWLRDYKKALRR